MNSTPTLTLIVPENFDCTGNPYEALQRRQENDGSTYTGLITLSHQQSTQETVDEGETFGLVCVACFLCHCIISIRYIRKPNQYYSQCPYCL